MQKQGLGFIAGLPCQMHPESEHMGSKWSCPTPSETETEAWYKVCVLLTPIAR